MKPAVLQTATATDAAAPDAGCDDEELHELLTDYRWLRVSPKKLVHSHIVGKVVSFLSECCEASDCPAGVAVTL